jgi:hypothetical protein
VGESRRRATVRDVGTSSQVGTDGATMKITRYGAVIITQKKIGIEGWLVEREPTDPPDATTEQLLVGVATEWALNQLQMELMKAGFAAMQEKAAEKKREIYRQAQSEGTKPADGQN